METRKDDAQISNPTPSYGCHLYYPLNATSQTNKDFTKRLLDLVHNQVCGSIKPSPPHFQYEIPKFSQGTTPSNPL